MPRHIRVTGSTRPPTPDPRARPTQRPTPAYLQGPPPPPAARYRTTIIECRPGYFKFFKLLLLCYFLRLLIKQLSSTVPPLPPAPSRVYRISAIIKSGA
eukprot:763018-Hanusia_phi.AAC.1